jgi:hypothetical protein
MLPNNEKQLENLAATYFVDELGMRPEEVPEAARNLTSAFEVLLRIDERINQQSHD